MPRTRTGAIDVGAVVAAKLAISALVLAAGFSHVSDDDFSRVVIAEQFAHTPRLDPSGTSWLPFPFWVVGAAMMAFGRSIGTARVVSIALGAASTSAVYAALRATGRARGTALLVVALGMLVPLDSWLGAATVPEAYTGALVAAALLAAPAREARPMAGVALLVASLSRYEAWPACAAFTAYAVGSEWPNRADRAVPSRRGRDWAAAALASAGPVAWMLWNAWAHGSATHFVSRVAGYRVAIGAVPTSIGDRLLGYPRALVATAPGLVLFGALGSLAVWVGSSPPLRALRFPVTAAALTLAFLIYGDVTNGAPTHHPERALLGVLWICAAAGTIAAQVAVVRVAQRWATGDAWIVGAAIGAAVCAFAAWYHGVRDMPGRDPASARVEHVARGLALRAEAATAVDITPCAYEHFAVIAAFGAPERVRVNPPAATGSGAPCPSVRVLR